MSTGIFNTGNLTTDLAKKSFAGMITRLMPNGSAPLFAITSMLASETALAVEHGFFTKTMLFPEVVIAGAHTTETTILVDDSSNMLPGMILRNNTTGENMIVNSVVGPEAITVNRNVGGTAIATIADNEVVVQVGSAFEESSNRPSALNIIPVRITNYTQIFRNTWALSGTAESTQVIAGDSTMAESRQDCAAFHAADIEKALFFGVKSSGTRNGQPFRTMDGLISIVGNTSYYPSSYGGAVNIWDATGAFGLGADGDTTADDLTDYTELEAMLDVVSDQATDPKGANERVLFCGGTAIRVLNNVGRLNGTYQLVDGQTNFGLRFKTLTMPRATFRIIEHPLFNTNAIWSKMAIAVDLATFRLAYLGNRKTQNKEFNSSGNQAADNGVDATGGTLTTECTCVVKNPPANAVIYDLTGAKAG